MDEFSIDGGLTFWSLVTFACLFLVLARFVFKPFQEVLRRREATLREALDAAAKARREADAVLEQNRRQLGEARDETRRIIDEGHRVAASMKQESHARASRETGRMVEEARQEIDREVQKSLDDLKQTVAGLSVRVSRQVLKEQLDERRHAELADEFIERLKKQHAKRTN